jgi:hypothetical protein
VDRRLAALGLIVLVAAASGCGGASASSPVASSTAAPTATPASSEPSAEPSEQPSVSPPDAETASPSADASTGPATIGNGDVEPGRYRSTTLGPTIEFEVGDDGWMGQEDLPEIGFALIPNELPGGLSVVAFNGEVYAEACSNEERTEIDASAEAFVDWLAAHPELEAEPPVEVTLGGQPAFQVDVDAGVGTACDPWNWLWVLPAPVNDFHLNEGELARIIAADVGDATVVVVIESFEPPDHPELLELAQPILDSMTIEP